MSRTKRDENESPTEPREENADIHRADRPFEQIDADGTVTLLANE